LREQRDPILHYLARDGATDGQLARVRFQFFISGPGSYRRQLHFVRIIRVHPVSKQGDHPICWCGPEDNIGCLCENGGEIKTGAECLAHLIERRENVCLALQRLEHLVLL